MLEPRRYVIWGSAGHAKVLDEAIRRLGGKVVALFDNSPDAIPALADAPLIGGRDAFLTWVDHTPDHREIFALVAIGGARGGSDRRHIQQQLADIGLQIESLVHPRAFVADSAMLGAGSQVLAMAMIAAGATVGASCIINHKASVDHECRISDGVHLAPGATVCGCVTVGENVMIGAGAIVLPRLRIGSDSIVGAGSVVTRDVPDKAIVVGNPARIVRYLTTDSKD